MDQDMMQSRGPGRMTPPAPKNFLTRSMRRFSLAATGTDDLKAALLAASSTLWFLIFIVLPIVIVVVFGFTSFNYDLSISYSNLTLNHYLQALDPFGNVAKLTIRTLLVSLATTLGAMVTSYPVAYYIARIASEKRRGLYVSLLVIPFWISFVVEVYAILPWVQRSGYIGWFLNQIRLSAFADWFFDNWGFGSSNIVAPALIYLWGTYMIFPLFTSLLKIDKELLEAAQDLGAGRWRTFWSVTFPLSFPGLLTGSILVFISSFGAYVEPAMLAGKDGHLIGNLIYNLFNQFGNLPSGAAVSMVVIGVTVVLLYVYALFAEEVGVETGRVSRASVAITTLWERITALGQRRAPSRLSDGYGMVGTPVRRQAERFYDRLAERHGSLLLAIFFFASLISWYVPLIQVVVFSFNYDTNIVYWSHFSLRWYVPAPVHKIEEVRALFGDPEMMGSLWNSIVIGLITTAISLALGIPAAIAIVRYRFWFKRPLNIMIYTGLVMPSIVMGLSILVFINFLNDLYFYPLFSWKWAMGYASIIVGHITFCIPIVIVVLVVTFHEFDRSLEEAAMNLGADHLTTFFRVTLPIIKPGIVSSALLSFTFSFDEVIVTSFLKGEGISTLPVVMWSTLSKKIPSPELNAASTLIIGMSLLFVLLANKVQKGGTLFRF